MLRRILRKKENTYEYKFDTVKPPQDRVFEDGVMHYYENHSDEPPRELILKLGKKNYGSYSL